MDLLLKEKFDKLRVLKQTCNTAEQKYKKNPRDAENLTRWGEALMGQLRLGILKESESLIVVRDAISKLEESLKVKPKKHETLWLLGNAYRTSAFLILDELEILDSFDKAAYFYEKAVDEDPSNELYIQVLEDFRSGRELQQFISNPLVRKELESALARGGSNTATRTDTSENDFDDPFEVARRNAEFEDASIENTLDAETSESEKKNVHKYFKYDVIGWVILGVTIAAVAVLSKTRTTSRAAS